MTELQARHQSYNSAIYKAGEAAVKCCKCKQTELRWGAAL